jgi:hypothetical protein
MAKMLIDELRGRSVERCATVRAESANDEERKITFTIISKENAGERYDWWKGEKFVEEIEIKGVDTNDCNTFFKDHEYRVDNAIGRVENKRVEGGELVADVIFGSDEDSTKIYNKYKERVLSDVSVGYYIDEIKETNKKGEPTHVLITKCRLAELSAVWKGFDKGAKAKREFDEAIEKGKEAALQYEHRNKNLKLMEKTL